MQPCDSMILTPDWLVVDSVTTSQEPLLEMCTQSTACAILDEEDIPSEVYSQDC